MNETKDLDEIADNMRTVTFKDLLTILAANYEPLSDEEKQAFWRVMMKVGLPILILGIAAMCGMWGSL